LAEPGTSTEPDLLTEPGGAPGAASAELPTAAQLEQEIHRRRGRFPVYVSSVVIGASLLVLIKPLVAVFASAALFVAVPVDIRRTRTTLTYTDAVTKDPAVTGLFEALEELRRSSVLWCVLPERLRAGGRARSRSGGRARSRGVSRTGMHRSPEDGRAFGRQHESDAAERDYARKRIQLCYVQPPFLRTNTRAARLPLAPCTLFFMPDRILVQDEATISSLSYSHIRVTYESVTHAEEGGVPPGARVLRTRWKYETRLGRPDRRYRNNVQLPVVQYGRVLFATEERVLGTLQTAEIGRGAGLRDAVEAAATRDAPKASA
jgi:hypothetical protein